MVLYLHEIRSTFKRLLIWTLSIGAMCFGCTLLYASVEGSLQEMGELFSNMGAMSAAIGMDRISIGTLEGYYATEIALIHALGGAMLAAVLGCKMLSKEEGGHTSEFLNTFPLGRGRTVLAKYLALLTDIVVFQVFCTGLYILAFFMMGETPDYEHLLLCAARQLLMLVEIGSICFMLSAFSSKSSSGAGLSVPLVLFAADMMCRVVPSLEDVKYITPFYYCNAADVFTDTAAEPAFFIIGAAVTVVCFLTAWLRYTRKDLAA